MAPLLLLFSMSCRHFIDLASARLDRRLTFGEGLRYLFHWLICRTCRRVGVQYASLVEMMRLCDEFDQVSLNQKTLQQFATALDKAERGA